MDSKRLHPEADQVAMEGQIMEPAHLTEERVALLEEDRLTAVEVIHQD